MRRNMEACSARGTSRHEHIVLLSILLLSIILRMFWIKTVVARDEGNAAYVAMVWLRGYLPYGGPMASWNPPLAYLIYSLPIQFFGNEIIPIRMINNVLFWVSIVVLYLIAKDWYGNRVGLVSAFFYGVFMNVPILETQLAIPGSLSIPFIIFSMYFCSIYLRKGQRGALLVSGLLMSGASLIEQYQATGIILLSVILVYNHLASKETRTRVTKDLIVDGSVLVLGILLPFLFAFAYFWSHGAANDLIQVFSPGRLSGYASRGDVPPSLEFLIIVEALPIWLFALFGLVVSFLWRRRYDALLIAWIFLFLPIALIPPHFGRHFSQLMPAASILSGVVIVPMLELLPKDAHNLQKRTGSTRAYASFFFITVLVVSFIPSIYFQRIQYPNTNFVLWGGENVNYSFSNNWSEQQEIVGFLKSNASGKAVLIHGWDTELYWLSGHLAPGIRWSSSYKAPGIDITDQAYQEIFNQVKRGDFEYVILGNLPPDEIMQYVSETYFFVKNIGFYDIYSKYNAEGYSIGYSFVQNLDQAYQIYSLDNGTQGGLVTLNDTTYLPLVGNMTINGENRVTIKQHPIASLDSQIVDSNVIYSNISISSDSKLSFGVGMDPSVWNKNINGVVFKILVQNETGTYEMFSRYVNPNKNMGDRKWLDYLVDLKEFAGENVSICFVTTPGSLGSNAYDWAYWSKPLLLESQ